MNEIHSSQRIDPRAKGTQVVKVLAAFSDTYGDFPLMVSIQTTYLTPQGPQVIEETKFRMLDCGHLWQPGVKVVRCSNGHVIDERCAHMIASGRIVCEVEGCGKRIFGRWYSSTGSFLVRKMLRLE